MKEQNKNLTDAQKLRAFRNEVRKAFADYFASEGCSCCQNVEEHDAAKEKLGKLLRVKKYSDGIGYDFRKYRSH